MVINMSEEHKKDIITIRGINRELYNKAVSAARELGMSVGDFINRALSLFLSTVEGVKATHEGFVEGVQRQLGLYVGDIEELDVSSDDLKSVTTAVTFRNIKKLRFDKSVDQELFNEKVRKLVNIDELIIHKGLSKFQVLSRALNVKRVVIEE